jgi:hypothetical protein
MTLIIQKPTGAKLVFAKGSVPFDNDAWTYIAAVEAADGQILEQTTRNAITNFVLGCKADGIWPAIKASCILAGARTLNGALVPLVGAAPTNVGGLFVSGDYNRKTGLVGNGSTKYLNSNRAGNADPQDNKHLSVFVSTAGTGGNQGYIGNGLADGGSSQLGITTFAFSRMSSSGAAISTASTASTGFFGTGRTSSSQISLRILSATTSYNVNSDGNLASNIVVFGRNGVAQSNARLAFYSIGESLDLALLDARVTTLVNAFAAAIP